MLQNHLSLIWEREEKVMAQIAAWSQYEWSDDLIRVDLSYYANWATAYTTVRPTHIVLGTLFNPYSQRRLFVGALK